MDNGFESYYQKILDEEAVALWPEALRRDFKPLSCLAMAGEEGIFIVSRLSDGRKGILRVSSGDGAEDALGEYRVLSVLNDPRIPKALAFYEGEGKNYLVREYMEGQTLMEYVKAHGRLSEEALMDLALSLCEILIYLHGQNPPVIHRDLKPENIILGPEGELCLVDFGIARTLKPGAEQDTVVIGTRYYMAPEQFGGNQTDARSDLYALGMVMIYCATLSHDRTRIDQRFPYQRLAGLVARLVKADPENRLQSALELQKKLKRVQKRFRLKLVLSFLGLVLLSLILCLGLYLGRQEGISIGVKEGAVENRALGYREGLDAGREEGYEQGIKAAAQMSLQNKDLLAEALFQKGERNGAGNLLQKGLATADDQALYFSSGDRVYRREEGAAARELCKGPARALQVADGFLYYIGEEGIYRVPVLGGAVQKILTCSADKLWVREGRLYFLNQRDKLKLYSASLEGENLQKLHDTPPLFYPSIDPKNLYFCQKGQDSERKSLVRLSLEDPASLPEKLNEDNANWLNRVGDQLFYIAYSAIGSALVQCDLDGGNPRVYKGVSPRLLNVSPYGIFYPDSVTGQLKRVTMEGRQIQTISEVKIASLAIAGGYIFYEKPEERGILYQMKTDGTEDQKAVP